MPIMTFTLKGNELKSHVINLHRPLNLRYFKLLHVNHNITAKHINLHKTDTFSGKVPADHYDQTLLFAKLSFINLDDVTFYETQGTNQHVSNLFAVGETAIDTKTIEFKDAFKMLSMRPLQVHQPFTVELYALDWSVITTSVDEDGNHTKETSHDTVRPIKVTQPGTIADEVFMTLTFEYDEYDRAPRTH
jgi:hypothetical protein